MSDFVELIAMTGGLKDKMNGAAPGKDGRFSDVDLDRFEKLLIGGLALDDSIIKQLAERQEARQKAASEVVSDVVVGSPRQDSLS